MRTYSDKAKTSELPEALGDEVVDLVAQGREQEYLSVTQVAAVVREAQLGPDEADDLLAMLTDLGIEVVEDPAAAPLTGEVTGDGDEVVAPLDLTVRDRSSDPLRSYLTQIGHTPLLTAIQMVALAKRAHRAPRSGRQARLDRGQPAPRGEHRQTL